MTSRLRLAIVSRGMAAAAIVALLAGCSQTPGSSLSERERIFVLAAATWDLNKDGTVTCDEWKRYAGDLFDRADINRDGTLAPDEYQRIIAEDRLFEVADIAYYDTARRGRLTRAEFVDRQNPAFAILDKDKNCNLGSAELAGGRALLQGADTASAFKPDDKITPSGRRN